MDTGPIPWTAKVQYYNHYGFSEIETEMVEHCIGHLDEIVEKHHKEKQRSIKETSAKQAKKQRPPRGR